MRRGKRIPRQHALENGAQVRATRDNQQGCKEDLEKSAKAYCHEDLFQVWSKAATSVRYPANIEYDDPPVDPFHEPPR